MRIVNTRRISQIFFFILFVWFGIVSTVGDKFWQIRDWPVNWFLQLDPLVAVGTVLTTRALYWPLLWALLTIVLTILLGRFFCGWVCPFGAIHHFVGYLAHRKKKRAERIRLNKYRKAQGIKYIILFVFLGMTLFPSLGAGLQTGLLDPIPLVTRTLNLVLLPIADGGTHLTSTAERFYEGAWLVFAIFVAAVLLNLVVPRFYCRFLCPTGALMGILNRFALWRIGQKAGKCTNCLACEVACEGGCVPSESIRISECVLCLNCREDCREDAIDYATQVSSAGEVTGPDISRRGFVLSLAGGVFAVPAIRLGNGLGENWSSAVIRPPGAVGEEEFLKRCTKCGQCMRACPTNVIQPDGFEGGLESLWTPRLNNRIGSSGCQLNCVACGQVCPTAAIRPITLPEKLGIDAFAEKGPIRMGTAFVDRNRCLPWAMDKPCIVCQENCPVSPKAIYTQDVYTTIRDGVMAVEEVSGSTIEVAGKQMTAGSFATGDYYLAAGGLRRKIGRNGSKTIETSEAFSQEPAKGSTVALQIRLQRPFVDIEKCIGCGICEHECPVTGKRAIRVSAEGETRNRKRRLLLTG